MVFMKNPFKTSSRTSLPRQSENMKKEIHVLYDDPIIIRPDTNPTEESPAPADNSASPMVFLIVGSIVVLLCLWWLAPDWLAATLKNLIRQIFHSAGP
jgi:hypothetical protein